MLEEQYKNKVVELEKLKAEIADLNVLKAQVVRDINIPLLEAKAQAEKIIFDANVEAKNIIDSSNEAKIIIDEYVVKRQKEISELLRIVENDKNELKEAQAQLSRDKDMFENLKSSHAVDIKNKQEILARVEKEVSGRQGCLDSQEHTIRTRELQLKETKEKIDKDFEELAKNKGLFELDRVKLDESMVAHNKDKEAVEFQKIVNANALVEIKTAQNKISDDTENNKKDLIYIVEQNSAISKQKEMINAQFDLIEKNQKELEEKTIALNEREQLIAIKDKDVTDKIKILNELRLKTGGA